jgi:hypothetical protein
MCSVALVVRQVPLTSILLLVVWGIGGCTGSLAQRSPSAFSSVVGAAFGTQWRRRLRVLLIVGLAMFALYSAQLSDLLHRRRGRTRLKCWTNR